MTCNVSAAFYAERDAATAATNNSKSTTIIAKMLSLGLIVLGDIIQFEDSGDQHMSEDS